MTHVWRKMYGWEACARCGVVRRADDKNKPCPLKLPAITLRQAGAEPPDTKGKKR